MDLEIVMYVLFLVVIVLLCIGMFAGFDTINVFKKKIPVDANASEVLFKNLKKFTRIKDMEVLGKTTLEFEGETYTFDAIVLGYFGTLVINAQGENGTVYAEKGTPTWVQTYYDKKYHLENPTTKLVSSTRFLKDIYRKEKSKFGIIDSMTAFTSKTAVIAGGKDMAIGLLPQLKEKINSTKISADNGADIESMKNALAKYTK